MNLVNYLRLLIVSWVVLSSYQTLADGSYVNIVSNNQGQITSVVPRVHTTISMKDEIVTMVPFFAADSPNQDLQSIVNVRYEFKNSGAKQNVLIGFPEVRVENSNLKKTDGNSEDTNAETEDDDELEPEDGDNNGPCSPKQPAKLVLQRPECPPTIQQFFADVGGKTLRVRVTPGDGNYRRWFLFKVNFNKNSSIRLRNLIISGISSRTVLSNRGDEMAHTFSYVLHTGASWAGPIGQGEVYIWDGGPKTVRQFRMLKPNMLDDIEVNLNLAVQIGLGRPNLIWDYGNGRQVESAAWRFEKLFVVQNSSSRQASASIHVGALVVDRDPDTFWTNDATNGAIGEWVQLPTYNMGRIQAFNIIPGPLAKDTSLIKSLRITCFDLERNDNRTVQLESTIVHLEPNPKEQRVILAEPMGHCAAIRFSVDSLYETDKKYVSISEILLLER